MDEGIEMKVFSILSVMTLLVILPARSYQAFMQHLAPTWLWLVANGVQDFAIFFSIFLMLFSIGSGFKRIRNWFRPTMIILAIVLCFFGVVCAEYWVQRGLYPTGEELLAGLDDIRLVLVILHNWKTYTALLALGVATWLLIRWSKRFWNWDELYKSKWVFAIPVVTLIIGWGVFPQISRANGQKWAVVQNQAGFFTDQLWFRAEYVAKLYEFLNLPAERAEEGVRQLGMAPLRKETLVDQLQNVRAKVWFNFARDLKQNIKRNSEGLIFWHIILETTRADDYRHEGTQEIAPFQAAMFEGVQNEDLNQINQTWESVHVKAVFQAGARTTQSVSAQTCGLGTLPMGLSFSRDMGNLNARCLLDVFADAQVVSSFSYPGNLNFDRMHGYFQFHKMRSFVPPLGYENKNVKSVSDLTLSDRQVMHAMMENVETHCSQNSECVGSQYRLMLSMNHHYPYNLPSDYPESEKVRIAEILKKHNVSLDEHLQWQMLGYQDGWLRECLERLSKSPLASRSVVMITGDHSSNDPFWKHDRKKLAELKKRAEVPWVMLVPKAARGAVQKFKGTLRDQVLSLNDMPRLIQLIFYGTGSLDHLASEKKWFWMGGQSLSPWVEKTIGIASTSELFRYTQNAEMVDTGAKPEVALTQEKFIARNYELVPAAQFMSKWIQEDSKQK